MLTSAEIAEWSAYYELEPWGGAAEDHRIGVLAATTANYAGKVLKDGHHLTSLDFFPPRNLPEKKPLSVVEKVKAFFGKRKG